MRSMVDTPPASLIGDLDACGSQSRESIMRECCRVAALVLDGMLREVRSGLNTYDLDRIGKALMAKYGAESACFAYPGDKGSFPSYTCISINEEIVHGIGRLDRSIEDGDLVTVDVVVRYKGLIGDNARTILVGEGTEDDQKLLRVTEQALALGISQAVPGNRVGDISYAIQHWVEKHGFQVIREFVGHGVGEEMHEHPQIPNFGKRRSGPRINAGMTLAIEPMVLMGRRDVRILPDGWTVVSRDGKRTAHFEHTVLVTNKGAEVLTKID